MIIEIIKSQNESDEKNININIDSPLFEIFSKSKNFDKNCTIWILQRNIDKYKLQHKYSIIFNKLNNSNINYSSIYYIFERKEKIDYLKELNINFNNIKKLHLQYNSSEKFINNESINDEINILNNFINLEQLVLGGNKNILKLLLLKNVNFKKLKELNLLCKEISDLNLLEKVRLDKLEKLNLYNVGISDINFMKNVNCKELTFLHFVQNKSN